VGTLAPTLSGPPPNPSHPLAPARTTKFPREVPPLPWYRQTLAQMVMAGFLPFSAIYIELYYIFASIWGHKVGVDAAARPSFCMSTCVLAVRGACTKGEGWGAHGGWHMAP
jgi:hypothetical protein